MDTTSADTLDRIEQGIAHIFSTIDELRERINQHGKILVSLQTILTPDEGPKGPSTQELLEKLGEANKEGLAKIEQQVRLVGQAVAQVPEKTTQQVGATLRLAGRAT